MRYLWTDYDESDEFRLPRDGRLSIPAFEEQHTWRAPDGHTIREVNPLPRFSKVFAPLLDELSTLAKAPQDEETQRRMHDAEELVNVACHLFAQTDRVSGIHRTTLLTWQIDHDLRGGIYGTKAARIYTEDVTADEQRRLAMLLRKQEALGTPLFHEAAFVLFPGARLYFHTEDGTWLVAAPQEGTERDEARRELLVQLFSALGDYVRFFWGKPFGIVGVRATMHMDAMRLY